MHHHPEAVAGSMLLEIITPGPYALTKRMKTVVILFAQHLMYA
jgi:hypothetical protein